MTQTALQPNDTDQIRILMIEDCKTDVMLFKHLLGNISGMCSITNVPRLIDGFHAINQHSYDLIVLDLNLIDLDGVTNIAALKAQSPHTPVVVYTGSGDAKLRQEAEQVGANGFIVKGETSAVLLQNTIAYALAG